MKPVHYLVGFAILASLFIGGVLATGTTQWFLTTDEARAAHARRLQAKASQAEALAERAWIATAIDRAAANTRALAKQATFLGLAAATLIIVVGGAMATVLWLHKKASTIYPNAAGQWPVIIKRGRGWSLVHDPNRSLAPVTWYSNPDRQAPVVGYALPADTATMAQVTSQSQAVSLMLAAGQGGGGKHTKPIDVVQAITPPPPAPLPEVRRIDPAHVERLLTLDTGN